MPNSYVNKVVQSNGTTLIDISDTTAVASDVASGKYFYLASGEKVEGTASGGGSVTWELMADKTCTITTYEGMRNVRIDGYDEPLSANETYRITWGDNQYICNTIADPVGFTQDGYYMGNSSIFGSQYEDTGEPFVFYRTSSTRLIGATNDTASSVYVKIERQTTSSATLITKSITANGTYSASDDSADGYSEVTVNVPSGGASNLVTGTFTGTTTGTAMDIVLPYTGNGYPIAVVIYPSRSGVSTFNSLIQRYVIRNYCADKMNNNEPSYSSTGNANSGHVCLKYKSSGSNSTSYSTGGGSGTVNVYNDTSATASSTLAVQIRSKTKMSVFIASTSYGFAANIEYTYRIVYSE